VTRFGLYPWLPTDDADLVHPDDIALARSAPPFGEVVELMPSDSPDYLCLRYGAGLVRARPGPLQALPDAAFAYDAPVRTVAPRSSRAGRIRRIVWHHGRQAYDYYLAIDGKAHSARYRDDELEPDAGGAAP